MAEAAMWFRKGSEGIEEAKRREEERQREWEIRNLSGDVSNRLWLKPGSSAKVTFLDTEGFYLSEHQISVDGDWRNFFTCRKDFSECPLCEEGYKASYVAVYTVIDHSKYTSKKTGKEYKNKKRLLVAKQSVINKLARRRQSLDGDLTYAVLEFTRDKREECATGEDIEFVKRLQREEVLKFKPDGVSDEEWLAPFDYMTLFQPREVADLRKLVGQSAPVGSDDSTGMVQNPPWAGGKDDASLDDVDIDSLL